MWELVSSPDILGWIFSGIKLSVRGCHILLRKKWSVQSRFMPLNILAWNIKIRHWYYFVDLRTEVMMNTDRPGDFYSVFSGEIHRSTENKLL